MWSFTICGEAKKKLCNAKATVRQEEGGSTGRRSSPLHNSRWVMIIIIIVIFFFFIINIQWIRQYWFNRTSRPDSEREKKNREFVRSRDVRTTTCAHCDRHAVINFEVRPTGSPRREKSECHRGLPCKYVCYQRSNIIKLFGIAINQCGIADKIKPMPRSRFIINSKENFNYTWYIVLLVI